MLSCKARKFSSFSKSLSLGLCSFRFAKASSVLEERYICSDARAFFILDLPREFSPASCRLLSTASCFLKESFTSYDKKDVILTGETVATSNFSSGELAVEYNGSSRGRLHSALAEYTLDEDGFMNIEDLVDFLKRENAMDICVVKTSGDRRSYVDYFVIVSGVSVRHLRAMAKNLEQLFRGHEVRGIGRDGHVVVEGLENDHWAALDIGNIVVHFFLPEMRAVYELEKLWTLGPKYDDQSKAMLQQERFMGAVEFGTNMDESADE